MEARDELAPLVSKNHPERECSEEDCSCHEAVRKFNEHHDTPAAPERGETNAEQVKALAANWNQKSRLEQIIARHQMHDLSGLPNREYTASWEDVKLLIEQHSTLIAQRDGYKRLLDSAEQQNQKLIDANDILIAQRERLLEAAKFALSTPGFIRGRDSLQRIVDEVLTTSEQEGR